MWLIRSEYYTYLFETRAKYLSPHPSRNIWTTDILEKTTQVSFPQDAKDEGNTAWELSEIKFSTTRKKCSLQCDDIDQTTWERLKGKLDWFLTVPKSLGLDLNTLPPSDWSFKASFHSGSQYISLIMWMVQAMFLTVTTKVILTHIY